MERTNSSAGSTPRERWWETLLLNTDHIMLVLCPQGRVLEWNPEAERLFGRARRHVIGKNLFRIEPFRKVLRRERAQFGRVLQGSENLLVWERTINRRYVNWRAWRSLASDGAPEAIVVIGRDISAARRLESVLLRVSQRERSRVAEEIHAGLGQQLAALSFLAESLLRRIREGLPSEVVRTAQIRSLLGEAMEQATLLAKSCSQSEIRTGGLAAALRSLAERTEKLYGVTCRITTDEWQSPVYADDEARAMHAFRIIEESIVLAVSRGKATEIKIQLLKTPVTPKSLLVRVADNGAPRPQSVKDGSPQAESIESYAHMAGAQLRYQADPHASIFECCFSAETSAPDRGAP